MNQSRTVAAFDFDHTLSDRDNVLAFLISVGGRARVTRALIANTHNLLRNRRDKIKRSITKKILGGLSLSEVENHAHDFARQIITHHLHKEVVARAEWHRQQGHQLVIVSASYACYLRPIADHLEFDAVLATELETNLGSGARRDQPFLTGELIGGNVYGAEKVTRLNAWIGPQPATVWAYGDSAGDHELLQRADHAVRVGQHLLSPIPAGY